VLVSCRDDELPFCDSFSVGEPLASRPDDMVVCCLTRGQERVVERSRQARPV
jgi:hypothetical protein